MQRLVPKGRGRSTTLGAGRPIAVGARGGLITGKKKEDAGDHQGAGTHTRCRSQRAETGSAAHSVRVTRLICIAMPPRMGTGFSA